MRGRTGSAPPSPPREGVTMSTLRSHLEWKAEQILGQLRDGYSLAWLSAVYEVPEEHLAARVPEWRQRYAPREPKP
ncbi:predicted protein [Streptomyces albidoflavus]|nr:predicted protein [Streptomyces albidoflavus]